MSKYRYRVFLYISLFLLFFVLQSAKGSDILFGAYYYDGWSGLNDSKESWAIGAPRMLTHKLKFFFSEREPIWGWRDDDVKIMERQIDLASKYGVDFVAFCWY